MALIKAMALIWSNPVWVPGRHEASSVYVPPTRQVSKAIACIIAKKLPPDAPSQGQPFAMPCVGLLFWLGLTPVRAPGCHAPISVYVPIGRQVSGNFKDIVTTKAPHDRAIVGAGH